MRYRRVTLSVAPSVAIVTDARAKVYYLIRRWAQQRSCWRVTSARRLLSALWRHPEESSIYEVYIFHWVWAVTLSCQAKLRSHLTRNWQFFVNYIFTNCIFNQYLYHRVCAQLFNWAIAYNLPGIDQHMNIIIIVRLDRDRQKKKAWKEERKWKEKKRRGKK